MRTRTVEITTPTLTEYVAGELRAYLGRHEISRSELGRRLGVEDTWVGKRLKGQTEISLADLDRIADALGVEVTSFLPTRGNTLRYPPSADRMRPAAPDTASTRPSGRYERPPTRHDSARPTMPPRPAPLLRSVTH